MGFLVLILGIFFLQAPNTTIQLFDEGDQTGSDSTCKKLPDILSYTTKKPLNDYEPSTTTTVTTTTTAPNTNPAPMGQRMIIIESDHSDTNLFESLNNGQQYTTNSSSSSSLSSSSSKKILTTSGLSAHIVQNYSILAHEITSPIDLPRSGLPESSSSSSSSSSPLTKASNKSSASSSSRFSKSHKSKSEKNSGGGNMATYSAPAASIPLTITPTTSSCVDQQLSGSTTPSYRTMKDLATCQFCGRAMLKKNIPTHIRRAHTPKEELVCLNEEQNIFTFQHLKPGQRRKRSARAYDYSLMTATVSIDEDPSEGIENKFITEGEEILSTDLLQLADRIRYGVSQIPLDTLNKLVDILTKIEYSTQDEVSTNAKSIKNMICYYLTSGEEFKYKIRQVGGDIVAKKRLVNELRNDLKEIMARKVQLERRIQPLVCELQKLEDQHLNLIESLLKVDDLIQFDLISNDTNESAAS